MKKCAYCGNSILFGGKRDGNLTYCNARCQSSGVLVAASRNLPPAVVADTLRSIHSGLCPKCHGTGPIDVHSSFRVWSMVFVTSWSTRQHLCCASCGQRTKLMDVLFCAALGWWGIPWGLALTPIQIGRNLHALAKAPDPATPSAALERLVRMQLARRQNAERLPLAA
jgi:hypothetical protein